MRFVFVDRIVRLESAEAIETLKNVSATEDVFEDHFPGCPILPGALVVEVFEQTAQLLIALGHDFTRVGRLVRMPTASFRHFVRPGDQLRVRCTALNRSADRWAVRAIANVDSRHVAAATMEFVLIDADRTPATRDHARRIKAMYCALQRSPLELAGFEDGA